MHNPLHPGEILREYISGTGKTITEIAQGLMISRKNLSLIQNGHAGVSAEMAWKLSVAFGTSPEFWLNFQKNYDLWQAKQKVDTSQIKPFLESAA
ncbi:HigA family addiction module antitoxin [Pontibacter chitinilyticus]|uniref:HigA family addiction module antitoxin n=1 Tax=Pontibacter chitinilyticus TaxID=2674989 RepID=UPI003D2A2FD0